MPAVNGIITAPFNTWTIGRVIGNASGGIGALVSKSAEGGNYVSAFDANGLLIEGKAPYWNIFSPTAPASWETNLANFRLKLNPAPWNPQTFAYNLADFDGYNHNAAKPLASLKVDSYYNQGLDNYTMITGYISTGGIDWPAIIQKVPGDYTDSVYGVGITFFLPGTGDVDIFSEDLFTGINKTLYIGYQKRPALGIDINARVFIYRKSSKGRWKYYLPNTPQFPLPITVKNESHTIKTWADIDYYGSSDRLDKAKDLADQRGYDNPVSHLSYKYENDRWYLENRTTLAGGSIGMYFITGYSPYSIEEDKYSWARIQNGVLIDSNLFEVPS